MAIKFDGSIIKNEPVLITGLVSAVIALGLAFGFSLSDEQIGAIMGVIVIVLAILARKLVTPVNKVEEGPPPLASSEPPPETPDVPYPPPPTAPGV